VPDVARYFEDFEGYGRFNDGIWRAYRRLSYNRFVRRMAAKPPWRILDVGGGSLASLPDLLADERVLEYHIVDLVDNLKHKPSKLTFHKGDALTFARAYGGAKFDGAVVFGVLMYMPPERGCELLGLLSKALEPGAPVLVHEPNDRSTPYLNAEMEHSVDVAALAGAAGFEVLSARNFNVPSCRGALRRLGPLAPSLARATLAVEAAMNSGVDGLYLLRRR
jgi:hypothetical protein